MKKQNILLILAGLLLLSIQFNVFIGIGFVDILSDILAFILILIGGLPLCKRNPVFQKMKLIMILGLILCTIGQGINLLGGSEGFYITNQISVGITTIMAMYFSYYFMEGLRKEAETQNRAAAVRNSRSTWTIYSIMFFANFITVKFFGFIPQTVVHALLGIYAFYYATSIWSTCRQLEMDSAEETSSPS